MREEVKKKMQSYKFLLPTETLTKNELPERLIYSGQRVKSSAPRAEDFYKAEDGFTPDAAVIDEQITIKETVHLIEKSKEQTNGAKVILLTRSGESAKEKFLQSGADAVLPLNADADTVIHSLESLLGEAEEGRTISYEAELYERVSRTLCELGITPNYCGYRYLRDIIILVISEPDIVRRISKTIYPKVAKMHSAKPACIERGARTAISRSWAKLPPETKVKYFGIHSSLISKCPTNSEFIFIVAERILRDIRLDRKIS